MNTIATIKTTARIAEIIRKAVEDTADYIRKDQAAAYPLGADVWLTVKSKRVAKRVAKLDLCKRVVMEDGSLEIIRIDEKRTRFVAHKFCRASKLWNGPDVIRNTELASMFASLFHDLVWVHRAEIADKLGISVREVLRLGNDVFRLAWKFIDPSLIGRIKSWAAFQAVEFAAPWYHKLKPAVAVSAVLLVAGCSGGCYSLPDGEVEDAGGIEEVRRIMDVYGDGLGPDPADAEP